jgi:hypothetical protein
VLDLPPSLHRIGRLATGSRAAAGAQHVGSVPSVCAATPVGLGRAGQFRPWAGPAPRGFGSNASPELFTPFRFHEIH